MLCALLLTFVSCSEKECRPEYKHTHGIHGGAYEPTGKHLVGHEDGDMTHWKSYSPSSCPGCTKKDSKDNDQASGWWCVIQ